MDNLTISGPSLWQCIGMLCIGFLVFACMQWLAAWEKKHSEIPLGIMVAIFSLGVLAAMGGSLVCQIYQSFT